MEESKSSSSDENERSEQNDEVGCGRSYKCVFCKRGFTTAQALGGHMNIHRKDRIKSKPYSVPSSSSKLEEENQANHISNQVVQSSITHHPVANEVSSDYQTHLQASSWGVIPPHTHQLNQFREDWYKSLSLQVGPSDTTNNHHDDKREESDNEDELDLELRL